MTDLLTLEALAAMLDMTPAHIRDRLSKSRGIYAAPGDHLAIRRAADAVLARQDRPRRARAGSDDPT